LEVYSQSPLAKHSKIAIKLADFFAWLHDMNGDHAKDQKKLAKLLKEIKDYFMHETLGEEKLLEMSMSEVNDLLIKADNQKIAEAGGLDGWHALSDAEQLEANAKAMSAIVLQLEHKAYSQLPEDEKCKVDFFIWVGCAMHKDLNCVKGGNAE